MTPGTADGGKPESIKNANGSRTTVPLDRSRSLCCLSARRSESACARVGYAPLTTLYHVAPCTCAGEKVSVGTLFPSCCSFKIAPDGVFAATNSTANAAAEVESPGLSTMYGASIAAVSTAGFAGCTAIGAETTRRLTVSGFGPSRAGPPASGRYANQPTRITSNERSAIPGIDVTLNCRRLTATARDARCSAALAVVAGRDSLSI